MWECAALGGRGRAPLPRMVYTPLEPGSARGMRVVVVGASGNVGTSLLGALANEPGGVGARRRAAPAEGGASRRSSGASADIVRSPLEPLFEGADAVVHLAWAIQPARDQETVRAINVDGSRRVFEATAAGVPTLVYASSVGAYGPGPKDRRVDESWPTTGSKAPSTRATRRRSSGCSIALSATTPRCAACVCDQGVIFKREAASEIRRLFAGPLLPGSLLRRSLIGVRRTSSGLWCEGVHADDVGEAYRLAIVGDVHGAFNVAAEPPLDASVLARIFRARTGSRCPRARCGPPRISYRLRLQPSEPGWVDMGLQTPLMDADPRPRGTRLEAAHVGRRRVARAARRHAPWRRPGTPPLEPGGAGPGGCASSAAASAREPASLAATGRSPRSARGLAAAARDRRARGRGAARPGAAPIHGCARHRR